jgi:signal transduction histidine kinase
MNLGSIRPGPISGQDPSGDDLQGIEVYADPLLERVFFNLLDNSLKHAGR